MIWLRPVSCLIPFVLLLSPNIARAGECEQLTNYAAFFLEAHPTEHSDAKVILTKLPADKDGPPVFVVEFEYTDNSGAVQSVAEFETNSTCAGQLYQILPTSTTTGSGHAQPFGVAPNTAAGNGVASTTAVIGDFNADGQGDLAVALQDSNFVSVTLGSTGAPANPALYRVGVSPSVIVAADFNGDGIADLATANYGDSTVSILLGNKDGTFQAAKSYPAGVTGEVLAVADVNGDSKLDLVVASYGQPQAGSNGKFLGGGITVLAGSGTGTFGAPSTVGQGAPLSLVLADFTGDGKIDIAYGDYNLKSVVVLPGNGAGSFGAAVNSATAEQPDFLGFGDFNGDGIEDLAVLSNEANSISVLLGAGGGSFRAPVNYAVGNTPLNFSLVDLNNDNHLDIEVFDGLSDATLILLGRADGSFIAPHAYSIPRNSSMVAAGDFNGDGHPDFVTASPRSASLSLFLNQGAGAFGAATGITLNDGGNLVALATGDFNGDHKTDLVAATSAGIAILLGSSGGSMTQLSDVSAGGISPAAVATGDFNGDGKLDFVLAGTGSNSGSLAIYTGDGAGNFQLSKTYSMGTALVAVAAADLNGDGVPDLAVADSGGQSGNGNVWVLINQGKGSFGLPVSLAAGTSPTGIAVADMNLDKHADLVVLALGANSFNNSVAVLQGNGDGSFGPATLTPVDTGAEALTVADYNGDSIPDVIVSTCCNFSDLNYLIGVGDGSFQPLLEMPGGLSPIGMAVADFDGDGAPDVAVAASGQSSVASGYAVVMLNKTGRTASALNAASFAVGQPLASDSIASVFGTDIATQTVISSSIGTTLGGSTATWFDSTGAAFPADLFFVDQLQSNLQVPPGMADGPATVVIQSADGVTSGANVTLADTAPGIFTVDGKLAAADWVRTNSNGQVAGLNASNQLVPIPINLDPSSDPVFLLLFGTGIRHAAAGSVTVQVGNMTLTPAYAGAQGSFVGLDQINLQLPYSLKGAGDVAITVMVAGQAANTVHVTIQ